MSYGEICRDSYEAAVGSATAQDGGRAAGVCGVPSLAEEEIYELLYVV